MTMELDFYLLDNMKKILISYGTADFNFTLKRLKKEAEILQLFDTIIFYGPKNLPDYIRSNPLMAFKKGGGFWLWKPYVIWKTLQDYPDSIVVYVDAGCSLNPSEDWNTYFNYMNDFNTVLFHYRDDFDYKWDQGFKTNSAKVKCWTKSETLNYFDTLFNDASWRDYNKIMGGFIISKSNKNIFIEDWLKVSMFKPELIVDPFEIEKSNQETYFSEHRHDQSIITPIGHYFSQYRKNEVLIIPETSESKLNTAAVGANRNKIQKDKKVTVKTRIIQFTKSIIGEKLYNRIRFWS